MLGNRYLLKVDLLPLLSAPFAFDLPSRVITGLPAELGMAGERGETAAKKSSEFIMSGTQMWPGEQRGFFARFPRGKRDRKGFFPSRLISLSLSLASVFSSTLVSRIMQIDRRRHGKKGREGKGKDPSTLETAFPLVESTFFSSLTSSSLLPPLGRQIASN